MNKILKFKSLWYLLISSLSFSYLILPESAGISVPIFIILQFVCLYFLMPKKKPLLMFIPIMILSLNPFISANEMWRIPNFLVTVLLYNVMSLWMSDKLQLKENSSSFLTKTIKNIFEPFKFFALPFKWCAGISKNTKTSIRILTGIGISIPCLAFLLTMLSSADQIFSHHVSNFFNIVFQNFNFSVIFKILFGFVVGFYLFGFIYSVYQPKHENAGNSKKKSGDLIVLGILNVSVLAIYTIFVLIQFKYLFANSDNLPYGLTYTHYARRGFFELLFLTGLNILLILITIWLTKEKTGKQARLIKISCCYLCTITMILLASSFYRMWLYNADDGLTRLRFLVFGFLISEAIGLTFTFFYIIKQKFNIIAVYSAIGLVYYLVLNIVPMDWLIAKNQIDRYFETGKSGIEYTLTLSVDAAPQIARLSQSNDKNITESVHNYFNRNIEYYNSCVQSWQQWNLSVNKLQYQKY